MLELTASFLFLMSTFYGDPSASAQEMSIPSINIEQVGPETLESHVRESFKETPLLVEIARCESQFRQFGKDGKVLRGAYNKGDMGVMQINEYYHGEKAEELGLDLHTLDGNIAFAKWLYERYGDKPWVHSSKCWRASQTLATAEKVELAGTKKN